MKHEIPPYTQPEILNEEDAFLRPEHDPESYVNRLAQQYPIISAPGLAVYSAPNGVTIVFKNQPD